MSLTAIKWGTPTPDAKEGDFCKTRHFAFWPVKIRGRRVWLRYYHKYYQYTFWKKYVSLSNGLSGYFEGLSWKYVGNDYN